MLNVINEMAMHREDAILKCNSLGKYFIKHFHKIYNNPNSSSVEHWLSEMDAWWKDIKSIVLKSNNRPIRSGNIRDWFFTAGSLPEIIVSDMSEDELDVYDTFCDKLIVEPDKLRDLIKEMIMENGE